MVRWTGKVFEWQTVRSWFSMNEADGADVSVPLEQPI